MCLRVLVNFKFILLVLTGGVLGIFLPRSEEIIKLVQVYLYHIALKFNREMVVFLQPLLYLEHLHERPRHDTLVTGLWLSCHSVSLPGSCLSVSKNAHIESVDCALNQHLCVLKYLFLISFGSETSVEVELLLTILALRSL